MAGPFTEGKKGEVMLEAVFVTTQVLALPL
jgi:hypothetical protein